MAAQRLDPQATLIPDGDSTSAAPVKKGNPWTERKEIVAAGVGARSHSAGQQCATVDPGKSPVSTRIDLFEKIVRLIMNGFYIRCWLQCVHIPFYYM
jgi:hypothetical protein